MSYNRGSLKEMMACHSNMTNNLYKIHDSNVTQVKTYSQMHILEAARFYSKLRLKVFNL